MSYVVLKLNIDIELEISEVDIAASSKSKKSSELVTVPEFLKPVGSNIVDVVFNHGFRSRFGDDLHISQKHGGFSMYNTYTLETETSVVKLILNVRLSDHPSRPNLKERNEIRLRDLSLAYESIKQGIATLALLDIYCKNYDWGVQIFIGGDSEYNKPVTSFEAMNHILDGKLSKLVKKYS